MFQTHTTAILPMKSISTDGRRLMTSGLEPRAWYKTENGVKLMLLTSVSAFPLCRREVLTAVFLRAF